jgi:hypothetical protein
MQHYRLGRCTSQLVTLSLSQFHVPRTSTHSAHFHLTQPHHLVFITDSPGSNAYRSPGLVREPLTNMSLGISLDSAVQCVSLSKDIALRLKEFGKDGPDAPQPFRKLSATLPIITKSFERIQAQLIERQSDPSTLEIRSFLDEALRDIKKLHDCLERVLPKQGTSRLRKSLKAVKSVFREDEIMKISRDLEHYMVVWQHIERTWINATPKAAAISRDLWNVPSSRNRYFSGREDILSEMEILFQSFGANQPRVAVCGLGGIG